MISWDEELCRMLASQGYWVIRFDNRDVGLSTHFHSAGIPDISRLLSGEPIEVAYKLIDMAKDAVGLLDALGIEKAHIVGVSMGGMIAQTIAIHFPKRVRTLTSIMSTTSDPNVSRPKPEAQAVLVTPAPRDRAGYIEYGVKVRHVLSGGGFPVNDERMGELAGKAYDRGVDPAGFVRQYAAILASGSRKEALKSLQVPTLVIHGSNDPLLPVEGGRDTAQVIPGAKLEIIEGMGHELPPDLWPRLVELITEHIEGAH
jgi:pimeloyl-ACP methyl ester carboxylesterase